MAYTHISTETTFKKVLKLSATLPRSFFIRLEVHHYIFVFLHVYFYHYLLSIYYGIIAYYYYFINILA